MQEVYCVIFTNPPKTYFYLASKMDMLRGESALTYTQLTKLGKMTPETLEPFLIDTDVIKLLIKETIVS